MKTTLLAAAAVSLALAPSLVRAEGSLPYAGLCKADEEAYAGCRLRGSGKLLAFCIAKGAIFRTTPMGPRGLQFRIPPTRYITYRFGLPGMIELEFPKQRAGSASKFRYAQSSNARRGELRFRFRNGGFRYEYVSLQISRGRGRGDDNSEYISIHRGKRRVALLKCQDANR